MNQTVQRTIVVGGGLAGIASAYELQSRGLPTVIVEARDDLALETSFANGAMITPSMPDPWNHPGVFYELLKSLGDPGAAFKLRLSALPSLGTWGRAFLRNATAERYRSAARANFVLARASLERTIELSERLALLYDGAARGTLKVFREPKALSRSLEVARVLEANGLVFETLDAAGAVALEQQLAPIANEIVGAISYPEDKVGDARQFCVALHSKFAQAGGQTRLDTSVRTLCVRSGKVTGITTVAGEEIRADRVVVASGARAPELLRSAGVRLLIAPVKGYTLTFDVDPALRPGRAVIDDALHAAIVPIGQRLRVAGTAEIAGFDFAIRPERIDNLFALLRGVYPHIAEQLRSSEGQPWCGLRPVSADGVPFVGATRVEGLFVNAGHGHLGWTCAAGSAQLLGDIIEGRPAMLDAAPYAPERKLI